MPRLCSNAVGALQVPAVPAIIEITLLNAAAIGLTHVLRGYMRRKGWATLDLRALLPRSQ